MSGTAAWQRYWSTSAARGGRGCVPDAHGPVAAAQAAVWRGFARELPRGAKVIDLGTGSGAAAAILVAERRDLKPLGVDLARTLPSAPPGVKLQGGVGMEDLPFADKSFAAAISQFGYEYGSTAAAAGELARVVHEGGALLLMIHHRGGPLVSHNMVRREALRWARAPGGILEKAQAFAATGLRAGLAVPPYFRAAVVEAQQLFPGQSAAPELAMGILQRLEHGRGAPGEAVAMLGDLRLEAEGEVQRLTLMEIAARDEAGIAALAGELAESGFAMGDPRIMPELASGAPLAWLLRGTRGRKRLSDRAASP